MDFRPTASIEALQKRAKVLAQIRQFFTERKVWEVETPLLCPTTVTDPAVESIAVENYGYLQTSPEYAMKRLLAAGSGSIYQMGKVFRHEEVGRYHQHEFTMLEWYRVGFDHHELMHEVKELLALFFPEIVASHFSYQKIFQETVGIDPLCATKDVLSETLQQHNVSYSGDLSFDAMQDLLFVTLIEPQLKGITFIDNYPASRAALAKLNPKDSRVASRFEVYLENIELANGFHELIDAKEQRKRFEKDNFLRKQNNQVMHDIDELLVDAIRIGIPACAGVALGVDRLMMAILKTQSITDVISFAKA